MKFSALLVLFCLAASARTSSDKFNSALQKNIKTVIKDNPEVYETKNPGRVPASVNSGAEVESEPGFKEDERMKMNSILRQGVGLPKW